MGNSAIYRQRKYSFHLWVNVIVFSVVILPSIAGAAAGIDTHARFMVAPMHLSWGEYNVLNSFTINFYYEVLSIVSFLLAIHNLSYLRLFKMPNRRIACKALFAVSASVCICSVALKFW